MQKKKGYRKRSRFYVPLFEVPNSDHPLFRLVRKRIKWAKTHDDAKRHSRRFVARLVVIWIGLWFLWTITQVPQSFSLNTRYYESGLEGVALLIGFSILLSYLFDVMTIVYAANSLNSEINLGRWDLLRLAMGEIEVIRAKCELTWLRAWRLYLVMVSIRISTVIILIIIFFQSMQIGESPLHRTDILYVLTAFAFVAVGAFYFFLESFWRIKGIAVMGVGIASRKKHTTATNLYAFFVVIGSWIFKLLFIPSATAVPIAVILAPISAILDVIWGTNLPQDMRKFGGLGIGILVFGFLAAATHLYYESVERGTFSMINDRFK